MTNLKIWIYSIAVLLFVILIGALNHQVSEIKFYNRQQQDVINEQQLTLNRWQPIVAQSEKYNAEILNVLMAGPIASSSNLIYAVQNINLVIDQLEQQRSQARSEVITR